MYLRITIAIFLVLFGTGYATIIQPCPGIAEAIRVDIANCDAPPCPLVKGQNANVNMTFRVPYDIETGIYDIIATLGSLHVKFPPPDKNYCHGLINAYCPLDEGEIVTHNLQLPVLKMYPAVKQMSLFAKSQNLNDNVLARMPVMGISMTLTLTFYDESDKPIMCFQVPCKVVKPP